MANGKTLQRLKDDLDEEGCEQGRIRQIYIDEIKKSMNGIGSRITWATYLLIATLVGLISNLVIAYFKR